ncbi:hypothetical protein CP97_14815 [Aurantiacibacter atlanticus]|uniref:Uncharacterized protein n=1 Tax=Aurantiacibacter atlanticus TaxID=1648404 RepID=A0A161I4A4_9SPHN|nr:hypothetical protein CP97_14815 [Aurantiacibacter atlanticus]
MFGSWTVYRGGNVALQQTLIIHPPGICKSPRKGLATG